MTDESRCDWNGFIRDTLLRFGSRPQAQGGGQMNERLHRVVEDKVKERKKKAKLLISFFKRPPGHCVLERTLRGHSYEKLFRRAQLLSTQNRLLGTRTSI